MTERVFLSYPQYHQYISLASGFSTSAECKSGTVTSRQEVVAFIISMQRAQKTAGCVYSMRLVWWIQTRHSALVPRLRCDILMYIRDVGITDHDWLYFRVSQAAAASGIMFSFSMPEPLAGLHLMLHDYSVTDTSNT